MARQMKDSGVSWIGSIPADWEVHPARYAFSEVKAKNTLGEERNALQFKFGTIIPKTNFDAESDSYVADTITNYTIVEPGTIMLNGLNLNYDFKTLRVGLVKERGVITSAYLALKPDEDIIDAEFATLLFKGYESKMAFHNMGAGIRLTLGFKEFKNQPVLIPSLHEQKRIVSFLEHKFTEIDAVIAKTKATIEEYKKLKQSIITNAVTKGIRGNDRPMKDSGIEWIGDIPADWKVLKMKHLGKCRNGLTYSPENLVSEEEGMLVLRSSNIQDGKLVFGDNVYVNCEIREELMVKSGDILICSRNGSRALIGKNALIPEGLLASFGAFMMIFRCNSPRYVQMILNSAVFSYYLGTFLTSTINQLTADNFNNMQIVYCEDETEQEEITRYLEKKCAEIDTLIEKKTALLAEMETYKKSVIYEYVTGKKEVL